MATMLLLLSLTLLLASPVASSPPPSPPSLSFVTSVAAQGTTPAASVGVSHASANACAELPYCMAIAGRDCGWCYYTNTSMPGNVFAPTPPAKCPSQYWVGNEDLCQTFINCTAVPDCLGILGTLCGWCNATGVAMTGTKAGPQVGSCNSWIWDHGSCPLGQGPQQIHIAYGNVTGSMVVTFATRTLYTAEVLYREAAAPAATAKRVVATVTTFTQGNPDGAHYIHRAYLTGLAPGTRYTYYVDSAQYQSSSYSFTTMRGGSDWVPVLMVYGDMGRYGGAPSLAAIEEEVASGHVTAIVHVGDFAYDLHDDGGENGDNFLNRIQPIAATMPYMTAVGNHETFDNFTHYRHRFSMPRSELNSGYDMWFSWNIGPVHFISYSTEIYFSRQQDIQAQYEWLKADLAAANTAQARSKRPWVIAYGHRPMYCSNADGDDCTKVTSVVRAHLEELFMVGGVDVIIEAHEHSYERLWPVYNETVTGRDYINPAAPVHIITGAAGCNEADGLCVNPILKSGGDWSAFRASDVGIYGYGHLVPVNATHLYWDEVVVETGATLDAIWIEQHHHGARVV